MLAELVHHVIGVDPDRDWITLAVVDAHTTGVTAHDRFPATAVGYAEAVEFVDGHSVDTERAWAIEGTASYGRGLSVALSRLGEWVIEFDRPTRKTKDGAKSDHLDAVRAARETLGRDRLSEPRAHQGAREAIRVHAVTRAGAVRARTAAINELKAMIVSADEELRGSLRGLRTSQQVARCARFRERASMSIEGRGTRLSMRALARRIEHLNDEIDDHDRALKTLLDDTAPQLLTERGIGYITAAAFYLAWSHPGRCRSEAAFARLGGTSPVEATSGQSRPATDSTAAATANPTGLSTSSPSPVAAATQQPGPTSPGAPPTESPNALPSAASSASSPDASGDSSSTPNQHLTRHRSITLEQATCPALSARPWPAHGRRAGTA